MKDLEAKMILVQRRIAELNAKRLELEKDAQNPNWISQWLGPKSELKSVKDEIAELERELNQIETRQIKSMVANSMAAKNGSDQKFMFSKYLETFGYDSFAMQLGLCYSVVASLGVTGLMIWRVWNLPKAHEALKNKSPWSSFHAIQAGLRHPCEVKYHMVSRQLVSKRFQQFQSRTGAFFSRYFKLVKK